jgi:hypothetical protein
MLKKIEFSSLFRWFAKMYSLLFLIYYTMNRIRIFSYSIFRIGTSTNEGPWPAGSNSYGWLTWVFGPIGLLGVVLGLACLAWKEKRWLGDLVYPLVVLLLVVIGVLFELRG